jgi:hypothetical protein
MPLSVQGNYVAGNYSGHAAAAPAKTAADDEIARHATWGERVVTGVGVGAAVLVVALIAVLMGMA